MTLPARYRRISTALAALAAVLWFGPSPAAVAAESMTNVDLDAYLEPVPHPYDQAWYKALFPDVVFLRTVKPELLPVAPKSETNASAAATDDAAPPKQTASAAAPSVH